MQTVPTGKGKTTTEERGENILRPGGNVDTKKINNNNWSEDIQKV